MAPRDGGVGAVALVRLAQREVSGDEPVEPPVADLAVVPEVARIAELRLASGAPPIDERLRVEVVRQGEVVAEPFDVAPVRWAVAHDVAHADVRREDAAVPAAANVLEDERQPHHRDVADVQHRRPRDDEVAGALDLLRLEVVVGDGVVARGDDAVADVVVQIVRALEGVGDGDRGVPLAPNEERLPLFVERRAEATTGDPARRDVVVRGARRGDRRLTGQREHVALPIARTACVRPL